MKERCANMNHGRSQVAVNFCPTCGEAFANQIRKICNEASHASQRKSRSAFCSHCGLKLR